jgi:thiamine transport system ATP-binding protein
MNGGRVEQVGEPQAIYREPATPFVASFVGDNNLFEGRIAEPGDGAASVDAGETVAIDVGGETFQVAADDSLPTGTRVTFAVRPEHLRVVDSSDRAGDGSRQSADEPPRSSVENRLRARVVRSEFLGETTRVRLDWRGHEVIVRTRDPLDGEVTLGFAPGDVRIVGRD